MGCISFQASFIVLQDNMIPTFSERRMLLVGAVLCVIAAWFTIGYHHPDEHFQILEFANYKLGRIPASDLPWEFPAQIRPGLQPFLAYGIVLGADALGISNPFVQVFFMRLLCAAAALFVYWSWSKWLVRDLENKASILWMRLGLLFFWLMPYLNVRFTSENTSAICFFGGLLLLLQSFETQASRFNWKLVLAGLLLGLSFFFRYQIAFAGIGLGAWLLFQNRLTGSAWVAIFLGSSFAICLGLATDFWLYNEWVFAPYNYFFSNIVEGKAAGFGVEPVWWYLTEMPMALIPPLSLILLAFFGIGIWQKARHPLTWCVVPFILAHSLVAHKEVRFLFPLAMPFFFLATAGWQYFQAKYTVKKWMTTTILFCFGINAILLVTRIFTPAEDRVYYSKFLWDWHQVHPESTVYFVKKEPRKRFPLNTPFYENPQQRQLSWYTDPAYKNDTTALRPGDLMLFTEILSPVPEAPPGFRLKREFAKYPDWILRNNTNGWQGRTRIWGVYQLVKEGL